MARRTEADLYTYLKDRTSPDTDAAHRAARIELRLGKGGVPRNLAKARADLAGDWSDFAIEPVEESLYWMGECVALAFERKISEDMLGHRLTAVTLVRLYCEVYLAPLAPMAAEFDQIRRARNERKYKDEAPDPKVVARWVEVVTRTFALFEPDLRRRAAARLAGRRP